VPKNTDLPVMVITGTSKGLGHGLAQYYLTQNYTVIGCSRGAGAIDTPGYHHYQVDVSDEKQVRQWIRAVKESFKQIDVLICNAGLATANRLLTATPGSVLEPMIKTNVFGTYYVCREVAKFMVLKGNGRIITISSMAVGLHEEGTSAYSASKSAVVEMTKILAKELAHYGVTCNTVAPSMYESDALEALGAEVKDRALGKLTIKRVLTIEEIANTLSFFISAKSSAITGQVIYMGLVCE